jgi:hypothetical protein
VLVVPEYAPRMSCWQPWKRRQEWPEKDGGLTQAQCHRGSGEKALNSFVFRLHEGLLGRYLWLSAYHTDPGGFLCASILVVSS